MTSELLKNSMNKAEHSKQKTRKTADIVRMIFPLCMIPVVIAVGMSIPGSRGSSLVSVAVAILSCLPMFVSFERGEHSAREMSALAVMTAISVISRLIFAPVPGFKPVAALVIITGISFGPEAGFVTGSMTAIVSNVWFGQGMWTPFQMFAWGITGFLSGIVLQKSRLRMNRLVLSAAGIFGGVLFSLLMDIWTTLSFDGGFSIKRYLFYLVESLPFTTLYAVSNVILLLLMAPSLCRKLERIKQKYGIFLK